MLMVRRANMRLSIAAGRWIAKPRLAWQRSSGGDEPIIPELRERPGRGRQRRAGAGAVVIHLAHQRIDAVELQFLADEGDEGDIERRSVEIALEIEQEDFKQRRAIVEGRAAAEACDAIEALVRRGRPAPHRCRA